jgi:hypothetical protein
MKIVVKAEKDGQVVAQSEFKVRKDVRKEENLLKRTRKALTRLRQDHPDLDLFAPNVKIKFDKVE